IDTLLSKDFIEEAGRLDRIGKPIIYKTTLNFLNQFNLKSLKDLPDIEKFISDEEKNQIVDDEINMEIEDENK
ncbi:MAG: SMC-Scp complex subunit ScpB, partial [Parvimonas sp.]|nr:SMC-Scp complex subunit ScpB [Parvimonas sp.]